MPGWATPAAANMHAYISYAHAATQTATVLLCGGMPDPAALSAAAQRMHQQLEAVGALPALVQSAAQEQRHSGSGSSQRGAAEHAAAGAAGNAEGHAAAGGAAGTADSALLAVPNLPTAAGGGGFGQTPLLHFAYKLNGRQQYVMSPFSPPLQQGGLQQVRSARGLARCAAPG